MAEVILICSVKHEIKNNLLLKTKEESSKQSKNGY